MASSVAVAIELLLAYSAAGKFSRASSAGGRRHLQAKFYKSDRVGRRGLSEPREDFSRLPTYAIPRLHQSNFCLRVQPLLTYAIPWLYPWLHQSNFCLRVQPLESSLGRVPQAADGTCKQNFINRIVSVAEDCLSPERTFHGCLLMQFRGCIRGCNHGCVRDRCQRNTSHPARNFATNFVSLEPNDYKNRSGNRPKKCKAHADESEGRRHHRV